jgi:hypothetical protein
MVHHSASLWTSFSSMPFCKPSLSAAWIRNSEQYGSSLEMDSIALRLSMGIDELDGGGRGSAAYLD